MKSLFDLSTASGLSRRQIIQGLLATATTVAVGSPAARASVPAQTPTAAPPAPTGPFTVPPLGYSYDALEPFIDEKTMHLHHDKHHAAYVTNLNKAVADHPELQTKLVEVLLTTLPELPESIRVAVRNSGGGHYNHSLFWQMLKKGGGEPTGALADAINKEFGSLTGFKDKFTKTALGQFGSGWAWLSVGTDGKLSVDGFPNQDSPLTAGRLPLLGIDVWEHAYYVKYENRRPEYVQAFYNVVDWDFVGKRFDGRGKA